jgi:hypothetical protein
MTFVDYFFHLLPDGSVQMDQELKATSLKVEDGDKFTVRMIDNRITFVKEAKE